MVESRKRPRWVRTLKRGALLLFTLAGLLIIAFGLIYYPIRREAQENVQSIESKLVLTRSDPSVIESADGVVLYRISQVRRNVVDVDKLPSYVRYAMVAAEDRRFYDHRGVDIIGLFRSAYLAVRDRRATQGASTIDMQLAKKLVNGDERSFTRKLKDIATAQEIEQLKTKSQILNLYMNEVYFGEGAWGIDAAAQTYFGKSASQLTVGEAAMLARCVRSPSKMNPIKNLTDSLASRDYVLDIMRDEGWINEQQYDEALNEKPKINHEIAEGARWIRPGAGYFVDHVLQEFHRDNPTVELQSGGYRIETTLNWKLQRAALSAVAETIRANRYRRVNDAAFVLIDSNGRILAEVGGPGYGKTQWNVVTQGHRQPGSAFKAFLYAAAIKEGIVHPGDWLSNEPIVEYDPGSRRVWAPKNNKGDRIGGRISLTEAFASSYNLPAIHTIQLLHAETLVSYAKDVFGFQSELPRYDSLAIGTGIVSPLEMAEGYSVFMLRGDRVHPYPIDKVVGPDGNVVKEYDPTRFTSVLDPTVCQDIDDLLREVVLHGTGTMAADVPDARGKTGTTQNATDAWFCGYSDGLLGVAWVGNTNYKTHAAGHMSGSVFGGTVSAGMWRDVLQAAHRMGLAKQPAVRPTEQSPEQPKTPQTVAKAERTDVGPAMPPPGDNVPATMDAPQPVDPPATATTPPVQPARPAPQNVPPPSQPQPAPRTQSPPPPARTSAKVTKPQDDESDYVEVQVCADTGMRASIYCPETVTRRFKRGTEPKQICRLHTGG